MKQPRSRFQVVFDEGPDWLLRWVLKALRGLGSLCAWFLGGGQALRFGRLLLLAALAALFLAAYRVLPAVYGEYALSQEAATAAMQARALGEERVLTRLLGRAFSLGFTEAAVAPERFKLEYREENGVTVCAVSYDFVHPIDLYGLARLPLRVRGQVERMPVPRPPAADPERMVE